MQINKLQFESNNYMQSVRYNISTGPHERFTKANIDFFYHAKVVKSVEVLMYDHDVILTVPINLDCTMIQLNIDYATRSGRYKYLRSSAIPETEIKPFFTSILDQVKRIWRGI